MYISIDTMFIIANELITITRYCNDPNMLLKQTYPEYVNSSTINLFPQVYNIVYCRHLIDKKNTFNYEFNLPHN